MCFEQLARYENATEEQKQLAAMTKVMVHAFLDRRYADARRCAEEMEATFGASKLTALYRSMGVQYSESPPDQNYDGRIVLTEK